MILASFKEADVFERVMYSMSLCNENCVISCYPESVSFRTESKTKTRKTVTAFLTTSAFSSYVCTEPVAVSVDLKRFRKSNLSDASVSLKISDDKPGYLQVITESSKMVTTVGTSYFLTPVRAATSDDFLLRYCLHLLSTPTRRIHSHGIAV